MIVKESIELDEHEEIMAQISLFSNGKNPELEDQENEYRSPQKYDQSVNLSSSTYVDNDFSPQKSIKANNSAVYKLSSLSIRKKRSNYSSISPVKGMFKKGHISPDIHERRNLYATQQSKIIPSLNVKRNIKSPDINGFYDRVNFRSRMTSTLTEMPPHLSADSVYAIYSDNQQCIFQKDSQKQRQVASLTKLMTAYTVLSICNTFNIKIREHYVNIQSYASYMEGTSANLRPDEEVLIIDMLYGLLLPSGNDAGTALASYFGKFISFKFTKDNESNDIYHGSMDKFSEYKKFYNDEYGRQSSKLFVFQMNKNCYKLGLKDTHFTNPTGLTDQKNYSTAKDMAILTNHCLKNHVLRKVIRKKVYASIVKNEKLGYTRQVKWKNTNQHLYSVRECLGVKTGITPGAGPCLSAAYRIGIREIIVILLRSSDMEERYADAQKLYKWARKKTFNKEQFQLQLKKS